MPYRAPGLGDPRIDWILAEIRRAQSTLDSRMAEAQKLPDSEPSKAKRIARLNQMKREVDSAFIDLDGKVGIWAVRDIRSFYSRGHQTAATQLSAGFGFTTPHRDALDLISNDAYDDVATRLLQVREGFSSTVELQKIFEGLDPRQIAAIQSRGRSAVAQALLTGEDPRQVSRLFAQDLWKDGVSIIDAGGRQWNPESYTRMLVRTKSANAYNAGSMNKYAEEGVERVRVFDGVEDDPECAEANGQIWSLSYAMENVIEHPNCRRAFAPEQGKGPVDKGKEPTALVVFDKLQLGATSVAALRSFRNTGELNVSSTLARLLYEVGVEGVLGVAIPGLDSFVMGAIGTGFKNADAWVESFIDPVLYNSGLIKTIPPRAQLVRETRPDRFVDLIAESVQKTKAAEFLGDRSHEIDRVLTALDTTLTAAANGLAESDSAQRGGLKYARWVIGRLQAPGRYGQITGETLRQVVTDDVNFRRAWLESADYVAELKETKRLHQISVVLSHEEAQDTYAWISQLRGDIGKVSQELFARQNLRVDFPSDEIEEAYSLWMRMYHSGETPSIQLSRLAELDRELEAAQQSAFRRIQQTKTLALKQSRDLEFPEAAGDNFVKYTKEIWNKDEFTEDLAEFHRIIREAIKEAPVVPVVDIPFIRNVGNSIEAGAKDSQILATYTFASRNTSGELLDQFILIQNASPEFAEELVRTGVVVGDNVDPQKWFEALGGRLSGLQFDGSSVLWRGQELTEQLKTEIGLALILTDGVFGSPQQLEQVSQLAPSLFSELLARTRGGTFDELHIEWSRLSRGLATPRGIDTLDEVNPVNFQNMEPWLQVVFGGKVTPIHSGIHGVKYVVEMPSGRSLFLKPEIGSQLLFTEGKESASQFLHSWLGEALGGVESVSSRAWGVTEDLRGIAMPYVDDAAGSITDLAQVTDLSARKLALLDLLANDIDGHSGNFMVHRPSGALVSVDREFGFFQTGNQVWTKNIPLTEHRNRHVVKWLDGDDFDVLNAPGVRFVRITDDEADWIVNHGTIPGLTRYKGDYAAGMWDQVPMPLLTRSDGSIYLVTGRTGSMTIEIPSQVAGRAFQPAVIQRPTFYLTQEELDFVLMDAADRVAEIRRVLDDGFEYIPEETARRLEGVYGKSFSEILDDFAEEAGAGIDSRIDELIQAGIINITGGVNETVNANGLRVTTGEVLNALDDQNQPVQGLVLGIIEDRNERVFAQIAPGIGSNRGLKELEDNFEASIKLVEIEALRGSDQPIEVSFLSKIQVELDVLPEFTAAADEVLLFETTTNGILRRSVKKKVQVTFPATGESSFFVRSSDGKALFHQAMPDGLRISVEDSVREAIEKLPPEQRPLSVVVHSRALEAEDGRLLFGYFDPETREAHVSLQALMPDLRPDDQGRIIFDSIEQFNTEADLSAFQRVLDHELGHGQAIANELSNRSQASKAIWEQLLEEYPDLSTRADFNVLAREELQKAGLNPLVDNPVEALMELRLGIIDDINNSAHADLAKRLVKTGKWDGQIAPEVIGAVKRGDPEAHQELVAEIEEALAGLHGRIRDKSREHLIEVYGRQVLKLSEREVDRYLRPLLTFDPTLPKNWDPGSLDFLRWFNERLTGVKNLIPVPNTRLRKFWKEAGLDTNYLSARAREGGFTYDVVTRREPPVGWAVAIKSNEHVIENFDSVRGTDEFRRILEDYTTQHGPLLEQEDWYLGGWWDKKNNRFVLDTSRVHRDEISAAHFAFKEEQDAIFNLATFAEKDVVTKYADIDEYINVEVPDARRLKDELVDVLTSKNKTRNSIVDELDRPPPLSLKSFTPAKQDEIIEKLALRRIVEAEEIKLKNGKTKLIVKEGGQEFDASPEAIKAHYRTVLEAADEEYGFVPVALDNDEWSAGHRIQVHVGGKVSDDTADEMWDDLRTAVNILQDNDIKLQGPHGEVIVSFLDGTSMRKFGEGGKAPNAAVVGRRLYINQSWKKIQVSENRIETIIHEFAHIVDPSGTKAQALQAKLRRIGIEMSDLVPDSRSDSLEEIFADVFQKAMTGQLSAKVEDEVYEVLDLTLRGQDRFYRRWRRKLLATAIEYEVPFDRVVANAAAISPGMDAEKVNLPMALYMTRKIAQNKPLSSREVRTAQEYLREAADVYLKKYDKPEQAARLLSYAEALKPRARLSQFNEEAVARILGAIAPIQQPPEPWAVPWAWQNIEKGVLSLRGEVHLADIVVETKVRSFYNNLIDPLNILGVSDVTIDFHMYDSAFFANTKGGAQSFGVNPKVDGLAVGNRVIMADVVRELWDEGWGLRVGASSPAELQEVIWGTWRRGKRTNRWGDLPLILDVVRNQA